MLLPALPRSCAALTALLAFGSLMLQFLVASANSAGSAAEVLWLMARFFTILTNALVVGVFGYMALRGRRVGDRLAAGLVLWIGAVGLVYHMLLARMWDPQGLARWADQGLHTVVPLTVLAWWLAFAGRDRLHWADPLLWLLWPAGYLAYALVRGASDGIFPYPFLDPQYLSYAQLTWNVARLMEGFLVGGYILFGLTRLKRRDTETGAD